MDRKSIVGKAVDETLKNEDALGFKIFFFVSLGLAPLCFIAGWHGFGFIAGILIAVATSAAAFVIGFLVNAVVEVYWQVRLHYQDRRRS
jgi:hypothetical protein